MIRHVALAVALAGLAACGHAAAPREMAVVPPAPGMQIALYADGNGQGYAAVDDRRWLDVAGGRVLVPVDPRAVLSSLAIEPLSGGDLRVEDCVREALPEPAESDELAATPAREVSHDRFTPAVQCRAKGAPGRYLVRVFYVTSRVGYLAQHEVGLGTDEATVKSRFVVETPRWGGRAEVVLYDGLPGAERPPREVARGDIALDGSVATLVTPAVTAHARLRRIFDGAVRPPGLPETDPAWGTASTASVWVWVELDGVRLAPGPVRVQLDPAGAGDERYLDVPGASRIQSDSELRLPLWVDTSLRGLRQRVPDPRTSAAIAERVTVSVVNNGDEAVEVFVDEHVRPLGHRRVEHAWPSRPSFTGEVLRTKLDIAPGKTARCGYTIAYDE